MPIDASIYQNIKPAQINMPSIADTAVQAMTLSQLGMKQQQMQLQFQQQQAIRQAYAKNANPDGTMNNQGVLSDLVKSGYGHLVPELGASIAAQDKAQAEAKAAQADAAMKTYNITGPAFDHLASMPEDQRADAYSGVIQQLKDQGIDVSRMDHPYDPGAFRQYYGAWQQSKPHLENVLTQANIGEARAKTQEALANAGAPAPIKIGAEELGKFNEDVNNASSRKETGALMQTRDRADRLIALANSGAAKNETPDQRIARLNKTIPGLANEYSVGLASILQGGVPSDTLMKETGLDTVGSKIASLQQRFKAEPTAGNQGALINAYVEAAQKMRDFSAGRLGEVAQRTRSAYPFANKYFGKQMDQIASPLTAPGADAGPGATLAKGPKDAAGGGVPGVTNATASDKLPVSSVKPGDVRRGYVFNGGDPRDQRNWKKR